MAATVTAVCNDKTVELDDHGYWWPFECLEPAPSPKPIEVGARYRIVAPAGWADAASEMPERIDP